MLMLITIAEIHTQFSELLFCAQLIPFSKVYLAAVTLPHPANELAILSTGRSLTPSSSSSSDEVHSSPKTKLESLDLGCNQIEEESVIDAIVSILQPAMADATDHDALHQVLRNVFPSHSRRKAEEVKCSRALVTTIEDQLRQDNLQASPAFVDKVRLISDNLQPSLIT